MIHLIYIVRNTVNSKVYIGQTEKTLADRLYKHFTTKSCPHLINAIKRYGKDKFSIHFITICGTQESTDYWETYFIAQYKSNDRRYGYNIRSGGRGNFPNAPCSQETKELLAEKSRGENNCNSKLDAEKVIAIRLDSRPSSEIANQYNISSGTVRKIKNKRAWAHIDSEIVFTDHRQTPETKLKRSNSVRQHNKNNPIPQERKDKISATKKAAYDKEWEEIKPKLSEIIRRNNENGEKWIDLAEEMGVCYDTLCRMRKRYKKEQSNN
jgi:hypothetical protein